MGIDYALLKEEIATDEASLGYAEFVESGSDKAICLLLNKPDTEPAVSLGYLTQSQFTATFALPLYRAFIGTPEQWEVVERGHLLLSTMEYVDVKNPILQLILGRFVEVNITTTEEITALQVRSGTRAEKVFGAGTVISIDDVARAIRGDVNDPPPSPPFAPSAFVTGPIPVSISGTRKGER